MDLQFIKPVALCVVFANAIRRYTNGHNLELPRQIEIHPNLFAEFKKELMGSVIYRFTDNGDIKYHGVKIIPVWDAEYPRTIGHLGDIDYL